MEDWIEAFSSGVITGAVIMSLVFYWLVKQQEGNWREVGQLKNRETIYVCNDCNEKREFAIEKDYLYLVAPNSEEMLEIKKSRLQDAGN